MANGKTLNDLQMKKKLYKNETNKCVCVKLCERLEIKIDSKLITNNISKTTKNENSINACKYYYYSNSKIENRKLKPSNKKSYTD